MSQSKLYKLKVACSCGKNNEYDVDVPLEQLDELNKLRTQLEAERKVSKALAEALETAVVGNKEKISNALALYNEARK